MDTTVYAIIPAGNKPVFFLYGVLAFLAVVVLIVGALLSITVRGSQHASFELSPAGLRLRGDLYGREIPATKLRGAAARIVDLRTETGLRPTSRRMGTGLPGYGAGWFRLADGQKALIYLTDKSRVVYIPTLEDYSLLLSVKQPEQFLHQLAEIAPTR